MDNSNNNKKKSRWKIVSIVLGVLLIIAIVLPVVFINILFGRIVYVDDENKYTIFDNDDITFGPDEGETPVPSGYEPTPHPDEPDPSNPPKFNDKVPRDENIVNILLIGVEKSSPRENGRSDSIIIATLDKKNKELKLTSIMRDNYVYIPGDRPNNRINAAYAYGNAPLLMKTINTNFNLDLQKYVSVDFEMFKKVIERVGNVELYLDDTEAERVIGKGKKAGQYKLNPSQALKYVRLRKTDSDFRRTERQRKLLKAIYNKCVKLDPLTLAIMMYDIFPYITTNMKQNELMDLMNYVISMGKKEVKELRIPVNGAYKSAKIRGMSVLLPDLKKNSAEIRKFIYGY